MSRSLFIVACVATKLPHRAAARDLYRSDWLLKARAYVEQRRAEWKIISAMHGLIDPNAMIDPYEMTLNNLSAADRRVWGDMVVEQLGPILAAHRSCDIVLFAGRAYREPIMHCFGGRASVPMEGLGIGEQKAWLRNNLTAEC